MASGTNPLLKRAIERVLQSTTPTQVSIDLKVTSLQNNALSWTATFLESFTIIQDFMQNYGDDITTEVRISPRDYLLLHENMKDLLATVTFTYLGNTQVSKIYDIPPITRKYRVIIVNPQDLRRKLQGAKQRVEENMTITLRLVDPVLYDVRQKQYHGTFTNTTVEGVLRHAAYIFGIENLTIMPPDNVHVYDHLIIPPAKGFEEVFGFIQDRYGVYMNGICSYITDGRLYIYPPYDHRSETPNRVHFYLGEQGEHAGASTYHRSEGTLTEIVLDGDTDVIDLAQMSGENTGTGYIFTRSNYVTDGYMENTESGAKFTQNMAMTVSARDAGLGAPNRSNLKYAPTATDNIFALTSDLVKNQAEIVQGNWSRAVIGLLKPGHRVKYFYDNEGDMMTGEGILEACGYDFVQMAPIGERSYSYIGTGRVRFRMDPNYDEQ